MRKLKIRRRFTSFDQEMEKLMEMVNFEESRVEEEELVKVFRSKSWCNLNPPRFTDKATWKTWGEFVSKCSIDEQFFATFNSLKKRDEKKELVLYKSPYSLLMDSHGTIIAFVGKKETGEDFLSKDNWAKPFNFRPMYHKFHDNIYVPYTKQGIWEYIAISVFCCYITNEDLEQNGPLVLREADLLSIYKNIDAEFKHKAFNMNYYVPFVYLDDDKESAYVGYTSWTMYDGIVYTLWKLKWKDGCIVERTLAYTKTLVEFFSFDYNRL